MNLQSGNYYKQYTFDLSDELVLENYGRVFNRYINDIGFNTNKGYKLLEDISVDEIGVFVTGYGLMAVKYVHIITNSFVEVWNCEMLHLTTTEGLRLRSILYTGINFDEALKLVTL